MKYPKETELNKKKIVLELQNKGEANKGDSSQGTKRKTGQI